MHKVDNDETADVAPRPLVSPQAVVVPMKRGVPLKRKTALRSRVTVNGISLDSRPYRIAPGTQIAAPKVKKPRRRKKPTKTRLKAIADKLAGDAVRERGVCQAAGLDDYRCGGILQWAHIETRRNLRLRWESWGALCLCAGHHRIYSNQPTRWVDFLGANFPTELALVRKHRHEYFDGDYATLIDNLKAERLKNG